VQAISGCLSVICLGGAPASPAEAQLLMEKALPAEAAITHVLARSGKVLVAARGNGVPPHTTENSQRKAYTARTFRMLSGEFARRVKDNPPLALYTLRASSRLKVRYRSRSAMRSSAQSGSLVLRAAKWTRRVPRPVSTRSPTT
jgi:Haem-degrading